MAEGPQPYPVVYDAPSGSLQYVFQSGQITIPEASVNAITALTGAVTATGPGSVVATIPLTSAHLLVGNASNHGTDVAVSGDVTLANTGAFSLVNASVTGQHITGYVSGAGTVAATDTILQAIQKLNGNTSSITPVGASTEILFLNGSVPTGDTNFVWNSTTHRMGIGIAPTSYPIEILGANNTNGSLVQITDTTGGAGAGFAAQNNLSHFMYMEVGGSTRGDAFADAGVVYAASTPLKLISGSSAVSIAAGGTTPQLTVGTNGVTTFTQAPSYPLVTTAGTGTITPNALNAVTVSVPVSGAVTLNGPTNGYDTQKLMLRIINDGSHSVTLATGAGNFSFGTTITSYTNSVSLIDYIGVIWNASASRWHVVSVSQGL